MRVPIDRDSGQSSAQRLSTIFTTSVPSKVFRQALVTARRLGPKAQDAIQSIESIYKRIDRLGYTQGRKMSPAGQEVTNELHATLKALRAGQQPEDPVYTDPVRRPCRYPQVHSREAAQFP